MERGTPIQLPDRALHAGLSDGPDSAHTSKTMMLPELRALLAATPADATLEQYRAAAIDENAMGKGTATTRAKTFYFLRKLYTLDVRVPVFAAMRALWPLDIAAQPLIALECAVARDPGLRATAAPVLALELGDEIGPRELADAISETWPHRFRDSTRHHMGQNAAATWVQAGLLQGVMRKTRVRPESSCAALTFALYLGHLEGFTGPALFTTLWAQLLDAPESHLRELASTAASSGWLDVRSAGGMLDIGFSYLDTLTQRPAA